MGIVSILNSESIASAVQQGISCCGIIIPWSFWDLHVLPIAMEELPQSEFHAEQRDVELLRVSFGYQFKMEGKQEESVSYVENPTPIFRRDQSKGARPPSYGGRRRTKARTGSFSCLSGAAMGANATLANTRIGNGFIGEEILPGLDSPKTFRRLDHCPSFSKIESLMSSSRAYFVPPPFGNTKISTSAPNRIETRSFLNAADAQTAGGAAGEDRVQAVCSEEDGWLFCAIYDGFNGRDAADFLAGTLYENISFNLLLLDWQQHRDDTEESKRNSEKSQLAMNKEVPGHLGSVEGATSCGHHVETHDSDENFQQGVLKALKRALLQTEGGFMEMVEQEMGDRQDLAMVGSCVLVVLLHGHDLYTLNLGDSRAVLATNKWEGGIKSLQCVQLTEDHVVEEDKERERLLAEHPDDPFAIVAGRLKGKIKLTRAFGAGYLKKAKLNDALMGIFRVHNLSSPPYLSDKPHLNIHKVSEEDEFVVMGSDGLFDFFSNEEVVELVHRFISENPSADPAKYMLDQLLIRAAQNAGMTVEYLKNIPIGRRRKYHDDVTIMVVTLGAVHRTSQASTLS